VGPNFQQRVTGIRLFDYLDWVWASSAGTSHISDPLTLPPVQRSALWRPRQILDLWRSLLAGMPIGALYLSPPGKHRRLLANADGRGATTERIPEGKGYDLLDGQQRTNTMMLALLSPVQAGKCVWIAPSTEGDGVTVHLTTRSQPFGFTKEGEKLRSSERKAARTALEKDRGGEDGSLKEITDHKLYDWHIENAPDGWPPPPRVLDPAGRTHFPVAPLYALVAALRAISPDEVPLEQRLATVFDRSSTPAEGDCACRRITPAEVAAVCHALAALEEAEVALILAAPRPTLNGTDDPDWILTLFDRIGAGGTPLSGAERLFSVYKHYAPYVHDAVVRIGERSGRVMAPVEIAATAICIAAAGHPTRPSFAPPEAREFGKWMRSPDQEHEAFRKRLESLIQPRGEGMPGGTLAPAFRRVHSLVTDRDNPRSLPSLLAASLRPELLRTLVYWAVLTGGRSDVATLDASARDDVVRFALFWHLCVTDPGTAGWHAMKCLTSRTRVSGSDAMFPWQALMEVLVGENPSAVELVRPNVVEAYGKHPPSSTLRGWNERFGRVTEGAKFELSAQSLFQQWWKAAGILLWLQRQYFNKEFGNYDPTSEREEDSPVDLDHIQPKAAFDFHFTGHNTRFEIEVTSADRTAFRHGRRLLGDSIGNYRWVSFSVNRADGDCPIKEKLAVDDAAPPAPSRPSLADCRIHPGSRELWNCASGPPDKRWTTDRIKTWQSAVEERAVQLYKEFWWEAGFEAWFGESPAPDWACPSGDTA